MIIDTLKLTRDQLSAFIDDPDTLRQFEKLFEAISLGPGNQVVISGLSAGSDPNLFIVEPDGTWVNTGEGTTWDEVSQPFIGEKITSPSSDIKVNQVDITLDFETSARYPTDFASAVIQCIHSWKLGSDFRPHIHWIQNENNVPNILVEYRFYSNGEAVPAAWTLKALTDTVYPYTAGSILQITPFDLPEGFAEDLGISATFDCRFYRDVTNASGLFAGADTYG